MTEGGTRTSRVLGTILASGSQPRYLDGTPWRNTLAGKNTCPPGWVLDLMAERKMTGGFKTKPDNLCQGCNTYRSVNGACLCP
jgi:hypothetical protein